MPDVRPATAVDLEAVASWIRSKRDAQVWAGWRVDFPIDLQSLPRAIDFRNDNAFSLISGGELVAFGQLLEKPSRRGHLGRIIVNPAFRGRGWGEKLVRALLDRGRKAGLRTISLNVDSANPAAVSLYLKLGFIDATRPSSEPEAPGSRYMELSGIDPDAPERTNNC